MQAKTHQKKEIGEYRVLLDFVDVRRYIGDV